jgi:hypothetical protein
LGHLICLFTLIINIYGSEVGISTIKKFTSGRGWGMTPRGLSCKAFNLPSHPDHKYIWLKEHILRITHFSETTKDRNLIFGMGGDANVKLYIQQILSPGLSPTPLGNLFKKCDRDPHSKPDINH